MTQSEIGPEVVDALRAIVGPGALMVGEGVVEDYLHDEALTAQWNRPLAVVFPTSTDEVAEVMRLCVLHRLPVTPRGSGTGLAGGAIAGPGGIVLSLERMATILHVDPLSQVAHVQAGVTLAQLDEHLAPLGLTYPVFPGEQSASIGGNVATNAGGMRAVKYGVTRHQVLGATFVTGAGEVISTGGAYVKSSTGYDLTQLIIGSEGTLGIVTEVLLRLYPRPTFTRTLLAPFADGAKLLTLVPPLLHADPRPLLIEYLEAGGLGVMAERVGLDLGIPIQVKSAATAYVMVCVEALTEDELDRQSTRAAEVITSAGALEIYALEGVTAQRLLEAREGALWAVKSMGVNDLLDAVVPRAAIPEFMARVVAIAEETGSFIPGAGHLGDGNIHLSLFQSDPTKRHVAIDAVLSAAIELGGTISAEHGIGTEKRSYFEALEDPSKIALMQGIKRVFDPNGILNPGKVFE
ncbi:MAG: FAD-binding oxidoreductase [Acidimicrobiales bacterium]